MFRILIIVFLLGFSATPTSSCPSQCICSNAVIDSQRGRVVDCSGLFDEVLPSVNTNTLKLDFSENRLDRVPNRIKQLPELRELNLSHNRIHYDIQNNIFSSNVKLKILDLSNNYISVFLPDSLAGLVMLERLDLHNNLLATLSSRTILPLPQRTVLCLGDNHWDCLCSLAPLLERFVNSGGNIELLNTCRGGIPECYSPENLYGETFHNLIADDVNLCPTTSTKTMTPTFPSTTVTLTTESLTTTEETQNSSPFTKIVTNVTEPKIVLFTKVNKLEKVLPEQSINRSGFDDTVMMTSVGIILLALICSVFMVTLLVLWKTSAKRRRSRDNLSNIAQRPEVNSPWPLLQSQRRLPVVVPPSNHSSPCDYEEIPFETEGARYIERTCPGEWNSPNADQMLKVKYSEGSAYVEPIERGTVSNNSSEMTNSPTRQASSSAFDGEESQLLGNDSPSVNSSYSFTFFPEGQDVSQYIPMRSSVAVNKSIRDLYAPMENMN